jgi:hypothetical protein
MAEEIDLDQAGRAVGHAGRAEHGVDDAEVIERAVDGGAVAQVDHDRGVGPERGCDPVHHNRLASEAHDHLRRRGADAARAADHEGHLPVIPELHVGCHHGIEQYYHITIHLHRGRDVTRAICSLVHRR